MISRPFRNLVEMMDAQGIEFLLDRRPYTANFGETVALATAWFGNGWRFLTLHSDTALAERCRHITPGNPFGEGSITTLGKHFGLLDPFLALNASRESKPFAHLGLVSFSPGCDLRKGGHAYRIEAGLVLAADAL